MRLFLFAAILIIAVLGCSDGKLNLLIVFWGDSEDPSSASTENAQNEPKSSAKVANSSSSSAIINSSGVDLSSSSGSRGPRSSSAKMSGGYVYIDYPPLDEGSPGVKKGWASRYWDGCKPHCSGLEHIGNPKPWAIAKICNINNEEISTYYKHPDWNEYYAGYLGTKSSCEPPGGPAYTCWDMAPIAVNDSLAYGFAAINSEKVECGACYQLEFDGYWAGHPGIQRPTHVAVKGKTMIVMVSNTGGVETDQFDIMIPGGGTGDFDSFTKQLGMKETDWKSGVEETTFGGLLNNCLNQGINIVLKDSIRDGSHRANLAQWQECLRIECNRVFGKKNETLLKGCLWHADWFMAVDNPTLLYKKVDCPKYLIDKYRSSVDTEPPPLPNDGNPWQSCSIQGMIDCKATGWYD